MVAVLKITDGTNEIDLLSLPGLLLEAWRPAVPQDKGGGTFQQSPLSAGRQLVAGEPDNWIESFAFKVQGESQDEAIAQVRKLRAVLEKAKFYWKTDWQNEPVWIEAKASCETNTRYAHIMTGYVPEDENPFEQPFGMVNSKKSVMDDMTLIVEHTGWTETAPGTSTAVAIDGTQDFDGLTYGRASTTTKEVYISNHQNTANLTHIFVNDGGVFGPNLLGIGVPYALLPAVPAVGDIVYFGIDTLVADSGPFTSLVFDLQTAQADVTGITYEYWNGAAWTALTVMDNTNADGAMTGVAFDTTGVKSVHWTNTNMSTEVVNGVTAWWLRARVTAIGAAPTAPIQQNRDVYAIVRASVTIDNLQVGGDVPALANVKIFDVSDRDGSGGAAPDLYQTRAIVGVRSVYRGADFTPFLFVTNFQNPAGVTVTYPGAIFAATPAPTLSANGRVAAATAAYALTDVINIQLNAALMAQYYGKFRVFARPVRFAATGAVDVDFTFRLKATAGSGSEPTYSDLTSVTVPAAVTGTDVIDLGTIEIGSGLTGAELGDSTALTIQASSSDASGLVNISDIVLMPVDEFAADVASTSTDTDSYLQRGTYLEIDSIRNPSLNLRTLLFNTTNQVRCRYRTIANGRCMLQANTDQKLWFLFLRQSGFLWTALFEAGYIVQVNRQNQYLSMRGDS